MTSSEIPDSLFSLGDSVGDLRIPDSNVEMDPELEDEDITPQQVLEKMKTAWQNECCSPALLPHCFDLVECLVDQIEGMEENLSRCKQRVQLKISVHRMEIHRITYLINDYIRRRLQKIEANARRHLKEHEQRISEGKLELLSEQEKKFAARFAVAEAQMMGKLCLGRLAPSLQKISVPVQNFESSRVLAEIMEDDVGEVAVPDYEDRTAERIVSLEKESVHLIAFESVRDLIEKGQVRLL